MIAVSGPNPPGAVHAAYCFCGRVARDHRYSSNSSNYPKLATIVIAIRALCPFGIAFVEPVEDLVLEPSDLVWAEVDATRELASGFQPPDVFA